MILKFPMAVNMTAGVFLDVPPFILVER